MTTTSQPILNDNHSHSFHSISPLGLRLLSAWLTEWNVFGSRAVGRSIGIPSDRSVSKQRRRQTNRTPPRWGGFLYIRSEELRRPSKWRASPRSKTTLNTAAKWIKGAREQIKTNVAKLWKKALYVMFSLVFDSLRYRYHWLARFRAHICGWVACRRACVRSRLGYIDYGARVLMHCHFESSASVTHTINTF